MGRDKAVIKFYGERLIDRIIRRFRNKTDYMFLSAAQNYDTGLDNIPDDPQIISGPVGAIFTLAQRLPAINPDITSFVTLPVDAPFISLDLFQNLTENTGCLVCESPERLQPAFANWRCDAVNVVRLTNESAETPSLQWLARQCDAKRVFWPEELPFTNINTPDDLKSAEAIFKYKDTFGS